MSTALIFNREMGKYLNSNSGETSQFILTKYRESKSQNYNDFFDNFLYDYGIISFNAAPLLNRDNKYIPYLNCTKNNIFNDEKGCSDLSNKAHSLSECERIFAKYFISKLEKISVEELKNWNSENNDGFED